MNNYFLTLFAEHTLTHNIYFTQNWNMKFCDTFFLPVLIVAFILGDLKMRESMYKNKYIYKLSLLLLILTLTRIDSFSKISAS